MFPFECLDCSFQEEWYRRLDHSNKSSSLIEFVQILEIFFFSLPTSRRTLQWSQSVLRLPHSSCVPGLGNKTKGTPFFITRSVPFVRFVKILTYQTYYNRFRSDIPTNHEPGPHKIPSLYHRVYCPRIILFRFPLYSNPNQPNTIQQTITILNRWEPSPSGRDLDVFEFYSFVVL